MGTTRGEDDANSKDKLRYRKLQRMVMNWWLGSAQVRSRYSNIYWIHGFLPSCLCCTYCMRWFLDVRDIPGRKEINIFSKICVGLFNTALHIEAYWFIAYVFVESLAANNSGPFLLGDEKPSFVNLPKLQMGNDSHAFVVCLVFPWQKKGPAQQKQEGNVLQEPAAAMHPMFPLKSASRMSMIPNQLLEIPLMQL